MNRRAFFGTMVGGIAAAAAIKTFPFRVFSFPSEIKIATAEEYADYANFSEVANAKAWDEMIQKCAPQNSVIEQD